MLIDLTEYIVDLYIYNHSKWVIVPMIIFYLFPGDRNVLLNDYWYHNFCVLDKLRIVDSPKTMFTSYISFPCRSLSCKQDSRQMSKFSTASVKKVFNTAALKLSKVTPSLSTITIRF